MNGGTKMHWSDEKKCPICENLFRPNKHNQKFCSLDCRRVTERLKARIPKEQHKTWKKECVVCADNFTAIKGIQKTCSEKCRAIHRKNVSKRNNKKYWAENKEAEYERTKKWREENADHVEAYSKEYIYRAYHSRTPEQIQKEKEQKRAYGKLPHVKEKKRAYHQRPEVKARRKIYSSTPEFKERKRIHDKKWARSEKGRAWKKKYESSPKYITSNRMRVEMHHVIRDSKLLKHTKGFDSLGYSREELMSHLEKHFKDGMTWQNLGEWHIDHIRPIRSFDYDSIYHPEFKKCWALDNLQPLWAKENLRKGGYWIR